MQLDSLTCYVQALHTLFSGLIMSNLAWVGVRIVAN